MHNIARTGAVNCVRERGRAGGRARARERRRSCGRPLDVRETRFDSTTDVLLARPLRSVTLLARDRAVPGIFGVGTLVRDRARLVRPLGFERARFAVSDLDSFDSRSRLFDRDGSSTDILACVCVCVCTRASEPSQLNSASGRAKHARREQD